MPFAFDFGAWDEQVPRDCPRHGVITGGLAIRVEQQGDNPAVTRLYCPFCVIEAMDASCISFDGKDPPPAS